jgi:hypothetical protein
MQRALLQLLLRQQGRLDDEAPQRAQERRRRARQRGLERLRRELEDGARVALDHAGREQRARVALWRRRDRAVAHLRRHHQRGEEAVRGCQERALPKRLEERLERELWSLVVRRQTQKRQPRGHQEARAVAERCGGGGGVGGGVCVCLHVVVDVGGGFGLLVAGDDMDLARLLCGQVYSSFFLDFSSSDDEDEDDGASPPRLLAAQLAYGS